MSLQERINTSVTFTLEEVDRVKKKSSALSQASFTDIGEERTDASLCDSYCVSLSCGRKGSVIVLFRVFFKPGGSSPSSVQRDIAKKFQEGNGQIGNLRIDRESIKLNGMDIPWKMFRVGTETQFEFSRDLS